MIHDIPCNKQLVIEDGEEKCILCDVNKEHDQAVADRVIQLEAERPVREVLKHFSDFSLMNEDLKKSTFKGYTPHTPEQHEAKQLCMDYVKNFNGRSGLFLFGKPGIGKSHLLASVSRNVMAKHGKTAIFISFPRLLREIKETYNNANPMTEGMILNALEKVDLLVIDDLGAERADMDDKGRAWAKGKLNEVADFRVGKSTLYSSNYEFEELFEMYGERDFSRMVQYADPVYVVGPNLRLQRFMKN